MKDKSRLLATVVENERAGRRTKLTLADRQTLIRLIADASVRTVQYVAPGERAPVEIPTRALRSYNDRTLTFLAALPRDRMAGHDYMGAVGTGQPEGFIHALRALDGADFGMPLPALLRGAALDPVLAPVLNSLTAPRSDDPAVALLAAAFTVVCAVYDALPEERRATTAELLALTPAREDRGSMRLASAEFTAFILRHPEDACTIGAIAAERRTDDPAAIERALESATALRSGAL